jgi:hypothetical protein
MANATHPSKNPHLNWLAQAANALAIHALLLPSEDA